MYNRYSEADKQKVLDLYLAGEKTVKDISKETMVPMGTINSWIAKYCAIKRRPSKQRKKPAKYNGGRPKKIGPIRNCELKVKMTKQEIEELNKKALEKNIYVSDYVRGMLFGQVDNSVLFDRTDSRQRTITTNENKAKYFCKQFASLYILLDEDKLYSHFLRILYNISAHKVSITGFDIEQCSEKDINEAVRRLGIECADYYIIKDMEKD